MIQLPTSDDPRERAITREDDPRIKEGIELSINAIATGLRNSG